MMTRLIEMRMFLKQVVAKVDFWVLHFVHCHLRRLHRILVTVLLHFLHVICPGIKLTRWRNFNCCFDDRNFRARSPAVTLWLPKNETFLGGITALVSVVKSLKSIEWMKEQVLDKRYIYFWKTSKKPKNNWEEGCQIL